MRITFASTYRNAASDIARTAEELDRRQSEVTSGKRVLVPSDDPSAMVGMVSNRAEMGTMDRYKSTSDSLTARLTVADTVISDILLKIEQASATLTSAQGSVITQTQREAIAAELRGVRDGIYTDMVTQFRGTFLFSGTLTTTSPYTKNPDGSISAYQGNANTASVDVDRQTAMRSTFNGDAAARGTSTDDLFATLESLITAVTAADGPTMAAGSLELKAAFNRFTTLQTQIGTDLAALDDKRAALDTAKRAAKTRLSAHEDANMVEAITGLSQAETAYKAALGATATIGRLSLLDYLN